MPEFNLIDSHCHLHFHSFDVDRTEVLTRARSAGLGIITVGTMLATSSVALKFAEESGEGVWASVGLHPNHAGGQDFEDEDEAIAKIADPSINPSDVISSKSVPIVKRESFDVNAFELLARHPKTVAIGETGLDYYHWPQGENPELVRNLQKKSLRVHFALSDLVKKPLILHCREAHEELLDEIDRYRAQSGALSAGGVIHCFTANASIARRYIERGFYISLTGIVTFSPKKSAPELQGRLFEMVRALPLERLLIETDAPYLSPEPYRGNRNEPVFVAEVAKKIAQLRGLSYEIIAQATTNNAKRLFKLN